MHTFSVALSVGPLALVKFTVFINHPSKSVGQVIFKQALVDLGPFPNLAAQSVAPASGIELAEVIESLTRRHLGLICQVNHMQVIIDFKHLFLNQLSYVQVAQLINPFLQGSLRSPLRNFFEDIIHFLNSCRNMVCNLPVIKIFEKQVMPELIQLRQNHAICKVKNNIFEPLRIFIQKRLSINILNIRHLTRKQLKQVTLRNQVQQLLLEVPNIAPNIEPYLPLFIGRIPNPPHIVLEIPRRLLNLLIFFSQKYATN